MVNLYSHVRVGPFTWVLAVQIALTYVVPWLNATMGIAIGLRHTGRSSPCDSAVPHETTGQLPQCASPSVNHH
ncbi:putative membrane protein (plasmid) [Rhodococcus opacus]|uniref:Putative membrane protein n=1 Tax=Rhodococcus opacus TaxID=37919 RepID=A0A1B1KIG1_RHOOP|nr:putative membrane protein [Rhodococcus opacus]ANS32402.1 putative membrane protein [Rhodococcus opacus]